MQVIRLELGRALLPAQDHRRLLLLLPGPWRK